MAEARTQNATPFDVKDVELGHRGPECSFDAFVRKYGLEKAGDWSTWQKVIRGVPIPPIRLSPDTIGIEALIEGVRLSISRTTRQRARNRARFLDALYGIARQGRVRLASSRQLPTQIFRIDVLAVGQFVERVLHGRTNVVSRAAANIELLLVG